MSPFDRIKKRTKSPEAAPGDLVFRAEASFEIASCSGESALGHLDRLREEGRRSGFTAILLGGEDEAVMLAENRECHATSPEKYLRQAAKLDVDRWLKEEVGQNPEEYFWEMGEWPKKTPKGHSISAHLDVLSRRPLEVVSIAKIPTSENWKAPAYIGMGGWNACLDAGILTALAKRWHERFGAEIVSITHDVMEFSVKNPPTAKEQAIELAKEQYTVCSDIVSQGVETISNLAAILQHSNYWYFWWD